MIAQETRIDFTNITNLMMWSALVAMAVPWVTAAVNRTNRLSFARWVVFAGVCVIAAAGTTYFEGNFRLDGEEFSGRCSSSSRWPECITSCGSRR